MINPNPNNNYYLLATKKEKIILLSRLNLLLEKVNRSQFWGEHFKQNHFKYERKKLTWDYWTKIPLFSKSNFNSTNLMLKIKDNNASIKEQTLSFLLSPHLKYLELVYINSSKKESTAWRFQITNSYSNILNQTLRAIQSSSDLLSIKPALLYKKLPIKELTISNLYIMPGTLSSFLSNTRTENLSSIEKLIFSGIATKGEEQLARQAFKSAHLRTRYSIQLARAFNFCPYNIASGLKVMHPAKNSLIELTEIKNNEIGKIIVTTHSPKEAILIRYKSGFLGKVVGRKCDCKDEISFVITSIDGKHFLRKRKNTKYND